MDDGWMKRRTGFNPKRRIGTFARMTQQDWHLYAGRFGYGGNPEHKTRPGDYQLTPPAAARPGKTLCDAERDLLKAEALDLLRSGVRKGMISEANDGAWPQNVWSVAGDVAFEAQLENAGMGTYHGYPMPLDDPFLEVVLDEWAKRP